MNLLNTLTANVAVNNNDNRIIKHQLDSKFYSRDSITTQFTIPPLKSINAFNYADKIVTGIVTLSKAEELYKLTLSEDISPSVNLGLTIGDTLSLISSGGIMEISGIPNVSGVSKGDTVVFSDSVNSAILKNKSFLVVNTQSGKILCKDMFGVTPQNLVFDNGNMKVISSPSIAKYVKLSSGFSLFNVGDYEVVSISSNEVVFKSFTPITEETVTATVALYNSKTLFLAITASSNCQVIIDGSGVVQLTPSSVESDSSLICVTSCYSVTIVNNRDLPCSVTVTHCTEPTAEGAALC